MRTGLNVCVAATVAICVGVLCRGVVPGRLSDLLFISALIGVVAVPVLFFAAVAVLAWPGNRKALYESTQTCPIQWYLLLVLPAVTGVVCLFGVPSRVAFRIWQSGFDQALSDYRAGESVEGRRIGPFEIVEADRILDGGVYFAVHQGPDGIGPDTMSCGYCVEPAADRSPFGSKYYSPRRAAGEWYFFAASNDYY